MDSQLTITIVILLLVCTLFFFAYVNSKRIPQRKKDKVFKRLEDIQPQINSNDDYARRDAIIKLDNLLGRALNIRYINDLSCGDNLKKAKNLFKKDDYQRIWDVHKIRNGIVHNDEEVGLYDTQKAFKIYKMAIHKILQ